MRSISRPAIKLATVSRATFDLTVYEINQSFGTPICVQTHAEKQPINGC